MSDSPVQPCLFRTVDDEVVAPSWMSSETGAVLPAPFLRVDGAHLSASSVANDNAQIDAEPATRSRRQSAFPSAPQEHAPLADGGLRPSVIALSPVASAIKPSVVANPKELESKAQAEIMAEKQAFCAALLDIATLRARALREAEQGLTDLAIRIAQAILERELKHDPSLHLRLVRSTLAAFGDAHRSKLRASPRTYDAIIEVQGSAVIDVEGVEVTIIRDASLDGLGCVVEGEVNLVDGRVEERLAAVWRAFRAENQRSAAEET